MYTLPSRLRVDIRLYARRIRALYVAHLVMIYETCTNCTA